MVSIDVCSGQLGDENTVPADVESQYYYDYILKPS
jgi:hypothetical protein